MKDTRTARLTALFVLGALLLIFWNSPAVWPLKILVVLFHELGHAVAALLTGGKVVSIGLSPDQGGVTWTRGGWRFFILNAGYLGSLVAGVLLLFAGRTRRGTRRGLWALTFLLAGVTLLWVRPLLSFGFLFSGMAALALGLLARYAPEAVAQTALRALGVFSVLYALYDIRSDVFHTHPDVVSDATMLAELTWIPAGFWGVAWILAGISTLWLTRRWWT